MTSIHTTRPESTCHMKMYAGTTIDMYRKVSKYLDGGRVLKRKRSSVNIAIVEAFLVP